MGHSKPKSPGGRAVAVLTLIGVLAGLAVLARAGSAEDQERERMQRQLNEQVLAAPFSVEDQARIDAYVKNAMEKDLKPVPNPILAPRLHLRFDPRLWLARLR